MGNAINGYDEYGISADVAAESQAQRDARSGAFVSRRRRLRNRWNVRMVKGERAQQMGVKPGGNGLHR